MLLGLHTASLNFEIIREIGQEGRNSQVFLARDKQLDGEIVVKRIEKGDLPNADEYYAEAKVLYSSKHQNVVQVNYGCEDEGHIYIAMPFYKNGSMKSVMDIRFLTVREIVRYSIQFLQGLNNIHTKGLMHFDIKPDNIMLSDSDEALLSDFGLAKAMDELGLAEQGKVYNKQVPPEAFTSTISSIHYDIYLAGLTLYRMANGNGHFYSQLNFSSIDTYKAAIEGGHFPDRESYLLHIPKSLIKVINKAISVAPEERHQNVLQLINDLSAIKDNLDWQYRIDKEKEIWILNEEDKITNIELRLNNNDYIVSAKKTIKNSGNELSIKDHCYDGIKKSQVKKVIQHALKHLS